MIARSYPHGRHRMGMIHFSNYAKAAGLRQGVIWYAVIGIGTPIADEKFLTKLFRKFETIQGIRPAIVTIQFILLLCALAMYL
jgi:hypothetical protein